MGDDIPAGFQDHFRRSPVTDAWRPLYSRRTSGIVQIGLRLRDLHCNSRGFIHGGVIATLSDNAMGLSLFETRLLERGEAPNHPEPQTNLPVTVSLAIDFIAIARISQWLQINPRIVQSGRSMGFVDALVTADDAIVARATASFRVE